MNKPKNLARPLRPAPKLPAARAKKVAAAPDWGKLYGVPAQAGTPFKPGRGRFPADFYVSFD